MLGDKGTVRQRKKTLVYLYIFKKIPVNIRVSVNMDESMVVVNRYDHVRAFCAYTIIKLRVYDDHKIGRKLSMNLCIMVGSTLNFDKSRYRIPSKMTLHINICMGMA